MKEIQAVIYILMLSVMLMLFSCEEETVKRDYPRVRTLTVTNISENGATFVGEVYEEGNVEITEHGFVWSTSDLNITTENGERILLGSFFGTGTYNADISTTLKEGINYYVTAFVMAGEYTVYGNTVEFTSLGSMGPLITDFTPKRGVKGDTILIKGSNFSWLEGSNQVYFNDVQGTVYRPVTDTALYVGVPYTKLEQENYLSVETAGNKTTYLQEAFIVELPEINDFTPKQAFLDDTIKIQGRNLNWVEGKSIVCFNDFEVTVYSHVADSLVFVGVPLSIPERENTISVEIVGNRTSYEDEKLIVNIPEIAYIIPSQGYWGDTISVKILYLRSELFNGISIGNLSVTPMETNDSSMIKFILPAALESTESNIIITIPERTITSATTFSLLPPVIDSISPLSGNWSSIVTLYGHFNPTISGTTVKFGEYGATIQSLTKDSIKVSVPAELSNSSNLVYMYKSLECISDQQFSLLPPEIISVSPMSDYAGGIVTITGNNFSPNSSVTFNDLSATIISASDNEVKCYVPGGYNGEAEIALTSGIQEVVYSDPFQMTNPIINSFYPADGTIGDTVTIECEDYNSGASFIISTTPGTEGKPLATVSVNNNVIKAAIDNYKSSSGYIGARVVRNGVTSLISNEDYFTINSPVISSFSPLSGTTGTEVTITGSNFSPVAAYNRVVIYGYDADITYSDRNEIRAVMPSFGYSGDYVLTVYVGSMKINSEEAFSYTSSWSETPSAWRKLPALPFTSYYGFAMNFDDKVIVANGTSTEKLLYIFDPASGTFSRFDDQTYDFHCNWPAVVVKDNIAYMFGSNNGIAYFYSFDYESLTINKISDYPGAVFGDQILLDGDSVLYMGAGYSSSYGYNKEFWKYSLSSGTWTQLNDLPGKTCHTNEFTVNNRNYIVFNNDVTDEYDPVNDSWEYRVYYPGYWCRFKVDVVSEGKAYIGYGDSSSETTLYQYDPETNVWVDVGSSDVPRYSYYISFSLNGKVYIGGGYNHTSMWRYDPEFAE